MYTHTHMGRITRSGLQANPVISGELSLIHVFCGQFEDLLSYKYIGIVEAGDYSVSTQYTACRRLTCPSVEPQTRQQPCELLLFSLKCTLAHLHLASGNVAITLL